PVLILISLYESYAVHPHLHSFPTRRSSDLRPPAFEPRRGRDRGQLPRQHAHRALPAHAGGPRRAERARGGGRGAHQRGLVAHGEDRKSTRLNSSHGSISYAVFCLKKKRTTD